MPHVIVKLWPGKSQSQKQQLADAIADNVTTILGYGPDSVSVGFEEVSSRDWRDKVYLPDILDKPSTLLKNPGYKM